MTPYPHPQIHYPKRSGPRFGFDYHKAMIPMVNALIGDGQFDVAAEHLLGLLRYFPGSFEARLKLGQCYEALNQRLAALQVYRDLAELNPLCFEAYLGLVRCVSTTEERCAALDLIRAALDRYPGTAELVAAMAILNLDLGREEHLKETIEFFKKAQSVPAALLCDLAERTLGKGYLPMARALLDVVVTNPTTNAGIAHLRVAELLVECGDGNMALSCLQRMFPLHAVSDADCARLVRLLQRLGQTEIAQQLITNRLQSGGGKETLALALSLLPARPRVAKRVVFVAEHVRAREAKTGLALMRAGWEVVLLYQQPPTFDISRFFSRAIQYDSPEIAVIMAANLAPQLIHVFSLVADGSSIAFIRAKVAPTVFDTNDIFEGTVNADYTAIAAQRFCIENSDGMCCRDLQLQHVSKQLGYHKPPHVILMPEYAWGPLESVSPPLKHSAKDGEIHCVLIGNFEIEKETGEPGALALAKWLSSHQIHFHIYLHWFYARLSQEQFADKFSEYLDLQRSTRYFHLHRSIPMNQVIQEISAYDFGVTAHGAVVTPGGRPSRPPVHFRFGGGGRNLDYLDAGLPILFDPALRFQVRRARQYGLAIEITPDVMRNPRAVLSRYLGPEIQDRARRAQTRESIEAQVPRLIRFYERVAPM